MISVENLLKSYNGIVAVDNISFEIKKGQIMGFLGPNGAGKTTTMKILTCYMPPSSGKVLIDSLDVTENSKLIRSKIGYLPEHAPIYAEMNVIDYLKFVCEVRNVKDELKAIKHVVEVCGLSSVVAKDIGELSKGFRQRVGLAQAMVHNPEILILDEPTTGLDPNQIIEIRNLIKEIGKEKTVIFSTHILQEVTATCDSVMIINKGKIVAQGTPEELMAKSQGRSLIYLEFKNADASMLEKIQTIYGVKKVSKKETESIITVESEKDSDLRESIFRAAVENQWILLGMHQYKTSMEDVFRELTV